MNEKDYVAASEPAVQAINSLVTKQNFVEIGQAVVDTLVNSSTVDTGQIAKSMSAMVEELGKSVSGSIHNVEIAQSLIESLVRSAYSSSQDAMVSVEAARAVVDEVKPYLPPETVESVETKIERSKKPGDKLSKSDWIAIIGILVTIFLFAVGQASSSEHEQKEERLWTATVEYQQESLAIQKQDVELKKEILEYIQNLQSSSVDVSNNSDSVRNNDQRVADSVDPHNEEENQESIQKSLQEQPDAED